MIITSWNINSVRLRIAHVTRFLAAHSPDVLCLQETKCPNDAFPEKAFRKAGYGHIAIHGEPGYNGVAVVSRRPFTDKKTLQFCGRDDTRHLSVRLDGGIEVHNFYVPAGGDVADPVANEKFAHKLAFCAEMAGDFTAHIGKKSVLVGDLNIAPCENDVWSHRQLLKVVSHTPVEVEALNTIMEVGGWCDVARAVIPQSEKVYTWWSYRAKDWRATNRGRRLDHVWVTQALRAAALRGGRNAYCVHEEARGWEKPSDHAPISLTLDL